MTEEIQKLVVFQKKDIRRQLHNGEWWFVINDVVASLTDSTDPSRYLRNLRSRDEELAALFVPVDKGASQLETPLELTFETAQNANAARRGGAVAGTARKQLEKETGKKVMNSKNYLAPKQGTNKLPKPKKEKPAKTP